MYMYVYIYTYIYIHIYIYILKYDNLIQDCAFEDIPLKYKHLVTKMYNDAEKYIPIQLNGTIGYIVKKNNIVY